MTPIHLTEEQSQAIQQSREHALGVIDPRTNTAYVLLRADVYERARPLLEQPSAKKMTEPQAPVAPQMLRSQHAFWRDLPELLTIRSRKRQWVAYHGDERIAFGATQTDLYQECFRRGLQRGEFYIGKIEEQESPPWGMLEGEWSLYETTAGNADENPPSAP